MKLKDEEFHSILSSQLLLFLLSTVGIVPTAARELS